MPLLHLCMYGKWEQREFTLHDSLSSSTELKVRFSLFYSSTSGNVSYGWNIDNFSLSGDLVNSAPGNLTSPSYDLTGMDKPIFEAGLARVETRRLRVRRACNSKPGQGYQGETHTGYGFVP